MKYDALNVAVSTMKSTPGPPMASATSSTRANNSGASARPIAASFRFFRARNGWTYIAQLPSSAASRNLTGHMSPKPGTISSAALAATMAVRRWMKQASNQMNSLLRNPSP